MEIVVLCFEIESRNEWFYCSGFCMIEIGESWEIVGDTVESETEKTEDWFVRSGIRADGAKFEIKGKVKRRLRREDLEGRENQEG